MLKLFPCDEPDCPNSRQPIRYNGNGYCSDHYIGKLEEDFSRQFDSWKSYLQPDKQLRAMMGRMIEEVWQVEGANLSKNQLCDKASNFRKGGKGFTFEVALYTRHFKNYRMENRVVQTWRVDILERMVTFISKKE